MKNQKYILSLIMVFSFGAFAQQPVDHSILPPVGVSRSQENTIWNKYCIGDRHSADIPKVNYQNDLVKSAVKKLAMVSPYSFYFYSGPLFSYELKKGKELVDPPLNFPVVNEVKNGRKNAHAFMTLLCGEFRDRPTLIEAKIKWVNKMHTLSEKPQAAINVNQDIWSQMSAHSYQKYIELSRHIFSLKEEQVRLMQSVQLGQYNEDAPVEPFTVCETKFIFNEYIFNKEEIDLDRLTLKNYRDRFNRFKKTNRCSKNDLDYIYDFRGDSNFKPNSPESNGMIWYSSTITGNCIRRNGKYILKESVADKFADKLICEKYFKNPFAYRWSAARAGLATWMLRDKKHDNIFSAEGRSVYIIPNLEPMSKPFSFKTPIKPDELTIEEPQFDPDANKYFSWSDQGEITYLTEQELVEAQSKIAQQKIENQKLIEAGQVVLSEFLPEWENSRIEFWKRSDLGFNSITGLGTKNVNYDLAYERLRDAVNRHTDWYSSGYEDGFGIARDQAYSPFVASSYEMSASDAFTAPGTTVQSPADGCKHWMFVFKLKKSQWYNTLSIKNKVPVDFNYHWFDETSLGTNHLADTEHAFDRLGTALEGEMDSILYLHKINTQGQVDPQCGYEQMGLQLDEAQAVGIK